MLYYLITCLYLTGVFSHHFICFMIYEKLNSSNDTTLLGISIHFEINLNTLSI